MKKIKANIKAFSESEIAPYIVTSVIVGSILTVPLIRHFNKTNASYEAYLEKHIQLLANALEETTTAIITGITEANR